jgi:hypothetical protein
VVVMAGGKGQDGHMQKSASSQCRPHTHSPAAGTTVQTWSSQAGTAATTRATVTTATPHQQVLHWDVVPLPQCCAQPPRLWIGVDVGKGHAGERLRHLWRRPVRVFVRVQLDNVLRAAAVAC